MRLLARLTRTARFVWWLLKCSLAVCGDVAGRKASPRIKSGATMMVGWGIARFWVLWDVVLACFLQAQVNGVGEERRRRGRVGKSVVAGASTIRHFALKTDFPDTTPLRALSNTSFIQRLHLAELRYPTIKAWCDLNYCFEVVVIEPDCRGFRTSYF